MNAVEEYWKLFAREHTLDQSPAELRYQYTQFYTKNREWSARDQQRFVDLMKVDSRFAKGTTNNFWKRLARQNSIPQTHAGELEEAFKEAVQRSGARLHWALWHYTVHGYARFHTTDRIET